jgi:flagellar biogenesis protein FliO
MKVHHILFLLWFVVFVGWLMKQFSDRNKRNDNK